MPTKEIKELRQAGKLEDALKLAKAEFESQPDNIWTKRNLSWVYYEYLKKKSTPDNLDSFLKWLTEIKNLNLPEDEKMIFDSCSWQIGIMVFALQKKENIDYKQINEIFTIIKDFHFTKPSESYSFLYKAFHKCYKNWTNYLQFADWWNFDYFRSEDFLSEKFNGKKVMSIVEQAYIAYSKKILEGEEVCIDDFFIEKGINKDRIHEFIPKLDLIIERHPEYQYPSYFKAKLLLALGDGEDVISNFLPFAKKKRNDFWVWELLADTFQAEDKRKMACLCKALSLKTPNEFLINTRQKIAEILIKESKFQEAKTEIEKILSTRNDKNWRIPPQLTEWTQLDWYKNNKSEKDNSSFYKQHVNIAEEILFSDIPEEVVVVEFVNENKSILNFVKNKTKHGFFKYAGMIDKPEIGDLISVRFNGESQNGFYKVLSIKKSSSDSVCKAVKDFQGNLKIREPESFGFVEDIFLQPSLIVKHELKDHDMIKGKAILSFNKKKETWGWRAFQVEKS